MLVFDQLRKNDPQLRALTLVVLCGLAVLLGGLWWVQIVSARDYQANLQTQSFRTVRIPAVRGKILDCNGVVMAENRPAYNIGLYLEELHGPFDKQYGAELAKAKTALKRAMEEQERKLGRRLSKAERKQFILALPQKAALRRQARYEIASNVVLQVSHRLREPLSLSTTNFERHYEKSLALPYPVLTNLTPAQIALFEEQSTSPLGVDLEIQSTRYYPHDTLAAHVLGHMKRDDSSRENEEAYFSFRMPDYRGVVGIEVAYDEELRGLAGAKSVLVNNLGYRQTENIWSEAKPGQNVVLTIDSKVQQAAERALQGLNGPDTRGVVVVMDVNSGDILAMASSPTYDPNCFVPSLSRSDEARLEELHAEKNRATQENYMPGSTFKLVVGMAALEAGWNPHEIIHVLPNPAQPDKGHIKVGNHVFRDTAPPGDYDFKRALKLSSNSYFITCGLRIGPERIIRMGHLLHLGERTGFAKTRQEVAGNFPSLRRLSSGWTDGNTGNMSIGQDPVWVTPLQIAVLTCAIANGGQVLTPRLVDRIESPDPFSGKVTEVLPRGVVREELGVSQRTLSILQEAMLADTEDSDGTGRHVRDHTPLPGLRICAKTGTAQVQDEHNVKIGQTVWFASFAPYCAPGSTDKPRYAVVVMDEGGVSGGLTCSPVAGLVYAALMERDQTNRTNVAAVAKRN
jgi:penicillin-binding protein 2